MRQFTAFGKQMQMMQNVHPMPATPTITSPTNTTETPTKAHATVQGATLPEPAIGDAAPPSTNMDMASGSAMNGAEFDTIMTDAENRKRWAEENEAEAFSKNKKAQNLSTLRRSGRGKCVLI